MHEESVIPRSMRRNHWMNQIAGHAEMRPDHVAFRYRGVDRTWRELDDRITRIAAALQRRGFRFGDRLVLLTLNSTEVIEAGVAAMKLGGIAVSVNMRLAPGEVAYILEDADADVLVVDGPLVPLATEAMTLTDRVRRVVVLEDSGEPDSMPDGAERLADLAAEDPGHFEPPDVTEDTAGLIIYTSGTTGRPKGAVLDHANLFAQAVTNIRAYTMNDESDVWFLTAPLFHIAGWASLSPGLVLGSRTVLHPLGAFDATEMLDAWEAERATIVFCVPTQWQAIVDEPRVGDRDLVVRVLGWGAAPASETLLRAMSDWFPDAHIIAQFGQTEMSPVTCVLQGEDALRKIGSVGPAIPTIQYRIVDDDMAEVAPGEIGEIVYRGPTLMQGYWRKPEATAEAMEGGWFHSGDLVREDEEGFIYVIDRKKDMIISGGENVYCAEVENVIHGHPDVYEVAVYGRSHEKWGEIPIAAIALRQGADPLTLEALTRWLEGRLARFKQPKDLVVMDSLPRNAGGKVVKGVLRDQDPA